MLLQNKGIVFKDYLFLGPKDQEIYGNFGNCQKYVLFLEIFPKTNIFVEVDYVNEFTVFLQF